MTLLSELCGRWVERIDDFLVRPDVVGFNLLDVCGGLGLRVVPKKIDLNKVDIDSDCRKIFYTKNVDFNMIYDLLLKCCERVSLDDFCWLQILLGICCSCCQIELEEFFQFCFRL